MLPGQNDTKSVSGTVPVIPGWLASCKVCRGGRFPQTTDECTKIVVTNSC